MYNKYITLDNLEVFKNKLDERIVQYSSIPSPSSSFLGRVIQYTGATASPYTNGYFYKCVENGGVYSWENVNVQAQGAQLPFCPTSTNGTFILKCTVTSGVASYEWVPWVESGRSYMTVIAPSSLNVDVESEEAGKVPKVYIEYSDGHLELADNNNLTFVPALNNGKFENGSYTITLNGTEISTTIAIVAAQK